MTFLRKEIHMVDKQKLDSVKKHITIPVYFKKVIIPEMGDYYSDYTVNFEYKPVVKCPIHGEDTPSLRYYAETNTFYCFGCRAGGDVINLHRLFTEVITGSKPSFETAVEHLYKVFIQGKNLKDTSTIHKQHKINIIENSNSSLIRFNVYIKDLETKLLIDNSIEEYKKALIYNEIDNVIILVSLNMMNVDKAIYYIKEFIGGLK